MRKTVILLAISFFIIGPFIFKAKAEEKRSSARPKMIEVEEEVWFKLNQDFLAMQEELVRTKIETKMAQAEVKQLKDKIASSNKTQGKTKVHRVNKNESLWKIAKRYYNDPFKWRWIYKANSNQIEEPALIYPEQILDIPQY